MLLERDFHEGQPEEDFSSSYAPLDRSAVLMLSIIELLYGEHQQGRMTVSLAVICKRLDIRMSTLQRLMTVLSEQALVTVSIQKDRLVAALTETGEKVYQLLPAA